MANGKRPRNGRDQTRLRWFLTFLAVIGAGVALTVWSARSADLEMRAALLHEADLLAPAISRANLRALDGTAADRSRSAYTALQLQLRTLRSLNPGWKCLYLLGLRADGSISVLADSSSDGGPDIPCRERENGDGARTLSRVLRTRSGATLGPWRDASGVWVSALVPLATPALGEVAHILGVDVEGRSWWKTIIREALVPAALTLILFIVLLVGYVTRAVIRDAEAVPHRRWRHREVVLVLVAGVALSAGFARIARQTERSHQEEAFATLMRVASAHVAERFSNLDRLQVEGLGRFFEGSEMVTADEFRQYVEPLKRAPEVCALGWAPVVQETDATNRHPLLYVETAGGEGAEGWTIGRELGSDPALRAGLEQALTSGRAVAVALNPGAGRLSPEAPELALVRSVFDPRNRAGGPKGYTLAVVDLDAMLTTVLGKLSEANAYILLDMLELRAEGAPLRLVGMAPPDRSLVLDGPLSARMVLTRPVSAFNAVYAVVARPSDRFLAMHGSALVGIVLWAGLVLTAIGSVVVRLAVSHSGAMEQLVERRTADLLGSMRRYELLEEHSRTVTWTVDLTGMYTHVSSLSSTVYGYSPDELVGIRRYYELHPAEGRAMFKAQTLAAFARREPFHGLQNPIITKSGVVIWVSTDGAPILGPDGECIGYQGTDTDITYRRNSDLFCGLGIQTLRILREPGEVDELMRRLVAVIKEETDFAGVGIRLQDGDDYPFVAQEGFVCGHAAERTGLRLRGINGEPVLDDDGTPYLSCICGMVVSGKIPRGCPAFTEGGSCWSNDTEELMRSLNLPSGSSDCLRNGLGSILAVPICDDRGVVGVLQMNDDHKGRVSHEIVQIFECIAAHIGEALMRKRIEYDYHLLFRQMQEGVALHEIIRDDTGEIVDYRVLAVNPSYERLTGIAAAEAVGKTAREYTPITAQRWLQTFIHVVESGESAVIQDYFPRVRKHFRMVVFRPKLEQFAMVFTDISEQKRAEERLQESRREYASLLARMPGMVYRCGAGPEGAMEFVSDGCVGITGYSPADFVERKAVAYRDLIVPEDREGYRTRWDEGIRSHGVVEAEYGITMQDGTVRRVRERGEGVYDERGCLKAVEGLVFDTAAHNGHPLGANRRSANGGTRSPDAA